MSTDLIVKKNKEFVELKLKIDAALEESRKIIVMSKEDIDNAGIYVKRFKMWIAAMDEFRKKIIKPLQDQVEGLNAVFRKELTPCSDEVIRLKAEIETVMQKIKAKQQAENEKEKKELEQFNRQSKDLFGEETPTTELIFKTDELKNISADLTTVKKKTWTLLSISKVPKFWTDPEGKEHLLLIVDDRKLNAIRKLYKEDDPSPIDGIEFGFDENIRIK